MALPSSFNLATSPVSQALWLELYMKPRMLRVLRIFAQWALVLAAGIFIATFLIENSVAENTSRALLGLLFLLFSYWAYALMIERFAAFLANRPVATTTNLAHTLSVKTAWAAHLAIQHAAKQHLTHVHTASLLYFALDTQEAQRICARLLIDYKELRALVYDALQNAPQTTQRAKPEMAPSMYNLWNAALQLAHTNQRERIEIEDVLSVLPVYDKAFAQYLTERNLLPEEDMRNVAQWHARLRIEEQERKKFWLKKNLRQYTTIGKTWAAGYALSLEAFGIDISHYVQRSRFPKAVGHANQKISIARVLSKQRMNNVLLIGNPGSGRQRLIEDFTSQSALGEHQNDFLNYQRVIELNLPQLFASVQSVDEAEIALQNVFNDVLHAGNIVLVIDEFHNFVGQEADPSPGRIDITGMLSQYLARSNFPLIATTTYAGLHRFIEPSASLMSFFEKVEVEELSPEHTLEVLENIAPFYEHTYKKGVSYLALKTIIQHADKYIQASPFPKKALDLFDEAMGYVTQTEDRVLLPHHVAAVVTERTQIPVGELEATEKETLLDMEDLIHKRIVNQEEAVREIASAMRRARTDITTKKGPMGSFLFLGPTGVGKTETAKALTTIYFGSEQRMIRLDMSEFQQTSDVARLLGTSTKNGLLTAAVRENPFSLILLDELEKAHPNVLNIFLQALDEGHITDGLGRKTDFRHTIIIATSNAGYRLILKALREKKDFATLKTEILDYLFEQGIYRPEFINRFDGVILFTPLSKEHLTEIASLMMHKLQQTLKKKGVEFVITPELATTVARLGYDPTFGARAMRRTIQDKVENAIAIGLLNNTVQRGETITLDSSTFAIKKIH